MKVLRVLVIAVILLSVFSPVCLADSMRYMILGPDGLQFDCSFNTPGTYNIYGYVTLDTPAKGLEFSMPEGYATVLELTFEYPVTGDLETEAFMDFGECLAGEIQIFTMRIESDGYGSCPGLIKGLGPYPASQQSVLPRFVGCDDVLRDVVPPCSADSPDLFSPPDSAMAVPLSPVMSWSISPGWYCIEGIGLYVYWIEYGTDPDNLSESVFVLESLEWTLGPLQPATQYFWRVKVWDDYWQYAGSMVNYSEIRTFMTEGPVPVKRVTWGELKNYLKN